MNWVNCFISGEASSIYERSIVTAPLLTIHESNSIRRFGVNWTFCFFVGCSKYSCEIYQGSVSGPGWPNSERKEMHLDLHFNFDASFGALTTKYIYDFENCEFRSNFMLCFIWILSTVMVRVALFTIVVEYKHETLSILDCSVLHEITCYTGVKSNGVFLPRKPTLLVSL